MKTGGIARFSPLVLRGRFSFKTQILLIFILCLGLAGTVAVFVNAYLIARLKDEMKAKAVDLAETLGRRVSGEITTLLDEQEARGLENLRTDKRFIRQVELVLRGENRLLSIALKDPNERLVFSSSDDLPSIATVRRDEKESETRFDTRGMPIEEILLVAKYAESDAREYEYGIVKAGERLGSLHFMISESTIYRDLETDSREISRLLWSAALAFTGVLALGLYLIARLSGRHLHLLAENERLDRMAYLGTLASGLAHEIRNPLNAMSVNLAVAKEEIDEGEKGSAKMVTDALEAIRREVGRLNRSVTNFLAFAHPSAAKRENVDLREVVNEALDLLHPQIEESGVRIDSALPDGAELDADFSGLRQAIYNVLLNAVQAMTVDPRPDPPPRRIEIGGRRESAQWFIWVEDSGPGLEPGQEEKIFEVFHTTKAAGSGLGLPIARAIVEANEGEIAARRAESGGTRIEIVLPETGGHPASGGFRAFLRMP